MPRDTLEAILEAASRAPSGTNIQPWHVYVATGATRDALAAALTAAHDDPARDEKYVAEYDYYPREWVSPYIDRRRKVGWDLYGLLNIGRDEKARMHAQHARNFRFFDAPVALFFTLDRVMTYGAWLDCGMFLQGVMTAARARGPIPVRRPRSCRFTGSSPNTSAFPPTNSWCAGCRSAMRTPTRSRTASSPSARRSPSSRAFRLKTHDAALPFEQACIVRRTCRDASCHIAIEIDRA